MKKISIIGMGALGLMYGSFIQDNVKDVAVDFVMDEERIKKYADTAFSVNGKEYRFTLTPKDKASPADLLIVAVKYNGLESALDLMDNCISEHTVVISVMNGITSESIILKRYPHAKVLHSVAQGMDAMKFGNSLQYSHLGVLCIGSPYPERREDVEKLALLFDHCGIGYVKEKDIMYRLWSKFMLNVGINQTSMVYGQTYKEVLTPGESNRTMIAAFREVLAVARAEGINLGEDVINQYIDVLKALNPDSVPSMEQDRMNKKPTEVDIFAGEVISLGKKHGIVVPTNEFLYSEAKRIESEYF